MTPNATPTTKMQLIPKEVIKQAIDHGKALIKEGKSKVEAATAMFQKLKGSDRETVVAAFQEGAGLTEKGAVTYWYNCRRKASKASAKP